MQISRWSWLIVLQLHRALLRAHEDSIFYQILGPSIFFYSKMLLLHNSRVIGLLKGVDFVSLSCTDVLHCHGGLMGPYRNKKIKPLILFLPDTSSMCGRMLISMFKS